MEVLSMHMRDDSQVLSIYIEFVAGSMNGLDQLCVKENELVQKINLLNKKRNLQIIHDEYCRYLKQLMSKWGEIYYSQHALAETVKQSKLLEKRESLYAITLAQKCVEQFFYHMNYAVQLQIKVYEDEKKQKLYYGDFLTSFFFSRVKLTLKDLFRISLQAMKDRLVNVEERKKQSFILSNQMFLPDLSIRYNAGENVTDSCIDRIIAGLNDQKTKERAEFEEGVKNGSSIKSAIVYGANEI